MAKPTIQQKLALRALLGYGAVFGKPNPNPNPDIPIEIRRFSYSKPAESKSDYSSDKEKEILSNKSNLRLQAGHPAGEAEKLEVRVIPGDSLLSGAEAVEVNGQRYGVSGQVTVDHEDPYLGIVQKRTLFKLQTPEGVRYILIGDVWRESSGLHADAYDSLVEAHEIVEAHERDVANAKRLTSFLSESAVLRYIPGDIPKFPKKESYSKTSKRFFRYPDKDRKK